MSKKLKLEIPRYTRGEGALTGILVMLVLELLTYFVYYYAYEAQKGEILEGLNRTANVVCSLVDVDEHQRWRQPEQQAESSYQYQEKVLQRALESDSSLEFIYTLVLNEDSTIRFVFDPTPPGDRDQDGIEDKSYLMEVYESPSIEVIRCLKNHTKQLTREVYYDKWGGHISCMVPMFRSDGTFEGALGIDISVDTYFDRLRPIQTATTRAMLAVFLMSFLFGTVVWLLRRFQVLISSKKTEK